MATTDVFGAELHEGDVVVAIDGPHTIDHFGPYPGEFLGDTARRAYAADGHWCATVADHEHFHVQTGQES